MKKCFVAFGLLVVLGILGGGGFLVYKSTKNSDTKNARGDKNKSNSDRSTKGDTPMKENGKSSSGDKKKTAEKSAEEDETLSNCPSVSPEKRIVMFWQTEVGGCDKIPNGVTHVMWGFAEVDKNNTVSQNLQGHKDTLKTCIRDLRKRCILSFISIGGANNNPELATITNADHIADSALALVKEYDVDGLDIDDETHGKDFSKDRVVGYVKAIHKKLKSHKSWQNKKIELSFDEYASSADPGFCVKNEYGRCFPEGIVPYVDFINIMAYNLNKDPVYANKMYENAEKNIFDRFVKVVKDPKKITLGICIGNACAYGPGPSKAIVSKWSKYASTHGGMMIYAGSSDVKNKFDRTNHMIKLRDGRQ